MLYQREAHAAQLLSRTAITQLQAGATAAAQVDRAAARRHQGRFKDGLVGRHVSLHMWKGAQTCSRCTSVHAGRHCSCCES